MAHTTFQTDPSRDEPRPPVAGEPAPNAPAARLDSEPLPNDAPLRFLFATADPSEAASRWIARAARACSARGHAVLCLVPEGASWGRDLEPLPLRSVAWRGPLGFRGWLECRRALANLRPHCVVAGDTRALTALVRAGATASERPVFLRQSAAVVAAFSAPVRGLVTPVTPGFDPRDSRFELVADGVEGTAGAPPDRTLVRRELRLPRRAGLVLHLAPLERAEGQEQVLHSLAARARARASGTVKDSLVVGFVGTGPDESRLHVLAHDLGIKEQVLWIGHRKDLARYAAAADVVVAPAATPASGEALLLAAANAVPVVAIDRPAHRMRIEDRVTGILVPEYDAANIVHACVALLADTERSEALGRAARQRAAGAWSDTRLADELECVVYAAALGASPGSRAFFVDRDGTLVRNVPYNCDPAAVVLEPDAARALTWIRRAGFAVVLVSNQSAIGRGICTEDQVRAVNERLRAELRAQGADLDGIYICPHAPDAGCACRKPEPGLVFRALAERGYDPTACFMTGDDERDLDAGRRAGVDVHRYEGDWIALARAVLATSARRTAPAPRAATLRGARGGA